jgi:hypothetical protein
MTANLIAVDTEYGALSFSPRKDPPCQAEAT